jgi:hypothetical protein
MDQECNHNPPAVILPPEDDAARVVADQLRLQFGVSRRLLTLCEDLAFKEGGDPLGAVHTAADVLKATAQFAHGFARVARIETRHRSFHETIQPVSPPVAAVAELNCENPTPRGESHADMLQQLDDRLQRLADQEDHKRLQDYAASALGLELFEVTDLVPTPGQLRAAREARSAAEDA